MMDLTQIKEVLNDMAYKGKSLKTILRKVEYTFKNEEGVSYQRYGLDVEIHIQVKDRVTNEEGGLYTHYVYNPSELEVLHPALLIRRVKSMLMYLETHEVEENLIFRDHRVFDPHREDLPGTDLMEELGEHLAKIDSLKKKIAEQLNAKLKETG